MLSHPVHFLRIATISYSKSVLWNIKIMENTILTFFKSSCFFISTTRKNLHLHSFLILNTKEIFSLFNLLVHNNSVITASSRLEETWHGTYPWQPNRTYPFSCAKKSTCGNHDMGRTLYNQIERTRSIASIETRAYIPWHLKENSPTKAYLAGYLSVNMPALVQTQNDNLLKCLPKNY